MLRSGIAPNGFDSQPEWVVTVGNTASPEPFNVTEAIKTQFKDAVSGHTDVLEVSMVVNHPHGPLKACLRMSDRTAQSIKSILEQKDLAVTVEQKETI